MKKPLNLMRIVGLVGLTIVLVLSCQREGDQGFLVKQIGINQSAQAALDNNQMIATAQDLVNVTGSAFANQGITYGRVADGDGGDDDDDFDCKPSITNNIKIDTSHPDSL